MESMSNLITSETSTCKCLSCLCHSDSNLNITLRDSCIFLCGFVRFATVTLFTGEGSGFSFTISFFWSWGYHPNCRGGEESGLWLQSPVSGLLSFIKIYVHFLLYSKFDEVVIGRPLMYSLAIDQMDHPSSQLRIHALKKVINQKSSLLLRGTFLSFLRLKLNFTSCHIQPHCILPYWLIVLLGHGIELLQQPITMLLLISLLHLVQSSQDTVSQHVVLVKPHSPKCIGEAPIDLIFQGTHQTP